MDRITELLRLAEDSELPDTLPVWDICRLGYPEDQDQQQRFLEFLIRHIAKGTLATVGTVDLPEKDQPGYAVVTATVIGAGTRFRAYWEPSPPLARLAVPLLHQSALWALLDRTAFQPPPGPYLANWRAAPPTPASPLSTPAPSPVDASGRAGEGDYDDSVAHQVRVSQGRKGTDKQHAVKRATYAELKKLAKEKWGKGSQLHHGQMADELMLIAAKDGVEISRETLLRILKALLKEIGRLDLIHGIKKIAAN